MTTELIFRVVVAALLGGVIGLEREYRAKEAGFRTHFLVALGSALLMILSQYGFEQALADHASDDRVRLDMSRIAAQVVSGIGFIGAGTIIFQKHIVRGLTTAAGVWVVAAVGMACGAGMYVLSVTVTLLILIGLEAMNFLLRHIGSRTLSVRFSAKNETEVAEVLNRLRRAHIKIESYRMERRHTKEQESTLEATVEMKVTRRTYDNRILALMENFSGVTVEDLE